jgi:hypothetical protein
MQQAGPRGDAAGGPIKGLVTRVAAAPESGAAALFNPRLPGGSLLCGSLPLS